jgi:Pentapeptide repeats (9 copies)
LFDECHFDECHFDECRLDECHFDECHFDECRLDECLFDECCGAKEIVGGNDSREKSSLENENNKSDKNEEMLSLIKDGATYLGQKPFCRSTLFTF